MVRFISRGCGNMAQVPNRLPKQKKKNKMSSDMRSDPDLKKQI